jgi:hypothetical protein
MMATIWTVENHDTRGATRSISVKRVVNGNEDTSRTLTGSFPLKATKSQIKAEFKAMFLKEKALNAEHQAFFKTADLVNFETEVNS